jgi:hypothetical protein
MNKHDYDELIRKAETYLGQNMEINVAPKPSIKHFKSFQFIKINNTIGFAENGGEMNFPVPTGTLKSPDGKIKKLTLIEIVGYFDKK